MIKKKYGFKIYESWFYNSNYEDDVDFYSLNYSRQKIENGFESHTLVTSLSKEIEEIFMQFRKNFRYEIRSWEKKGNYNIHQKIDINGNDIKDFIDYYLRVNADNIERKKAFSTKVIDNLYLYSRNNSLSITSLNDYDSGTIVMHVYIFNIEYKTVRLLHSVINTLTCDSQNLGKANKFLHYKDIEYFKNLNFLDYDWGGYYFGDDIKLNSINLFKESFGGKLVQNWSKIEPISLKEKIVWVLLSLLKKRVS